MIANTLRNPTFASLLERLFAQSDAAVSPAIASMSVEERERLMRSKTDYLAFYSRAKDLWLPVARQTGELLYMLARTTRARNIVEFGTSFGIASLYLAAALKDNGGGRLVTTEFEPAKVKRAREHLAEGGVADLVEVREGDALETLGANLPERVDLVLLDGAKSLYAEVLGLVEPQLPPGALVVADNADWSPEYLAKIRAAQSGYMSVAISSDVEVSLRLG